MDTESDEIIEGSFEGSGIDQGDKALYKAITGGIKYILSSTFLIPTGDDPENEQSEKKTYSANKKSSLDSLPSQQDKSCPTCKAKLEYRPKGISKEGKPYGAFYSCSNKDCTAGFNGKPYTEKAS
jgi:hypothetical protein